MSSSQQAAVALRQAAKLLTDASKRFDKAQKRSMEMEHGGFSSPSGNRGPKGGENWGLAAHLSDDGSHPALSDGLRRCRIEAEQMAMRLENGASDLLVWVDSMLNTVPTKDPGNVAREIHCANANCMESIYSGTGDFPIMDRCLPCHAYYVEHGHEAAAAVIAARLRKRSERASRRQVTG